MAARKTVDVFERWTPIWHVFFYAMIATATALKLWEHEAPRARVLGLVATLVAWHALLVVRPGRGHRDRPRTMAVYLAGAAAISTVLVTIDPIFLMVAMPLYNHAFAFMVMRWAVPAAAALTAVIGLGAARSMDTVGIIGVVAGAGAALLFALYLSAAAEENGKRRALIEELERTRERLAFAERLAGKTEERQRIGRELHDTVTQQLVGIVMHLEAARAMGAEDSARALDHALRLAREGLAEARRLVWAERPAQLEDGSLTSALTAAGQRVAVESGLGVENAWSGEIDALPAVVQALVLRGVQEALVNVRKHARATRVAVSVSASEDLVTVDVQDDGVGFDPGTAPRATERGAGFGLRGLRERVEQLGGTLSIESARGAGTTLAIHVPLQQP